MSQQWNPLQDLMHLQDRMNRLFEDATQRRVRSESKAGDPVERADWTPDADIYETEENYLVALQGRLDNAGALFGLGQISRLKGEAREAAIYFNRVATLTADSKSPEFLYKFALEALRVGLIDEAKSALERSLELRPKDPPYLLALGIAVLRKGDLFEAEKLFRRVLQIQPANTQAQLHLGYVLLNQKKYDEARVWLEKSARPGQSSSASRCTSSTVPSRASTPSSIPAR